MAGVKEERGGEKAFYVVTGGTGFLGEHLVRQLASEGHRVRVLARSFVGAHLPPGVEVVEGNILNASQLERAFEHATGVFHLAGLVQHARRQEDVMHDVNVNGTLNVLKAAKTASVRRVVYASTSGTVAVSASPDYVADDSAPYAKEVTAGWPYYRTKIVAEELAQKFAAEHEVELICMRPTLLLGPGDRRLTSCRSVVDLLHQKVPFVPAGGLSFADVRDTASAFASAMSRGRPGATYLVGSENLTLEDYFHRIGQLSGVPPPWLKVPWMSGPIWAMAVSANGISNLFGRWDPSMDPVVVEMSQHFWYLNDSKAQSELGFQPRDSLETLKDTIEWLQAHMDELPL
eukprot:jgi/Mesen1/7167/ME000037S06525